MKRSQFLKILPAIGAGLVAAKHIKPEVFETAKEACNGQIQKIYRIKWESITELPKGGIVHSEPISYNAEYVVPKNRMDLAYIKLKTGKKLYL